MGSEKPDIKGRGIARSSVEVLILGRAGLALPMTHDRQGEPFNVIGLRLIWAGPTTFNRVEFEGQTEHARRFSLHLSNRFIATNQALGADERTRLATRLRAALVGAALREP